VTQNENENRRLGTLKNERTWPYFMNFFILVRPSFTFG